MKNKPRVIEAVCFVIYIVALAVDTALMGLFQWFEASFGVTFREIIYTVKSPLSGANSNFLSEALRYVLPKLIPFALLLFAGIFLFFRLGKFVLAEIRIGKKRPRKIDIVFAVKAVLFAAIVLYSFYVLHLIDKKLEITKFIGDYNARTQIYEQYYVLPDEEAITAEKPKNIIWIYMESMETTYASAAVGGQQPEINYIPNLTRIADDNISFSDGNKLGGFISAKNTDWTMAAIWATQTGAAFAFPIEGNSDFGNQEHFAKNTVTFGDILEKKGYTQEFLCGSDATFGGRKAFFEQHGNFRIHDLYVAEEEGYLTPDEEVNWGYEDWRLYEIAKNELTRIAAEGKPFNFTMLTVDTHHYDGWICPLCENTYPEQLANVLVCADKQIEGFLDWCASQPWYEDTVIVIQGDHPRMDQALVDKAKTRMVYNCFINTGYDAKALDLKNRKFNTMDIFPTVLAAMGYEVEGDRLGLGTNMFSDKKTLCEQLGSDYIDAEVLKYSQFYADNFY